MSYLDGSIRLCLLHRLGQDMTGCTVIKVGGCVKDKNALFTLIIKTSPRKLVQSSVTNAASKHEIII